MLTIQNLTAGYGKLRILEDITLAITPGTFTAILGPNGSGKSTLLKSIYGICDVFDGEARLGETRLTGLPTELVGRQGIAYVPQRENIFAGMTVAENLSLAVRALDRDQRDRALGEAYGLFPILAERRAQRAGQLSGGERQMLAMAMGWLSRPQVMLLDEPSAGLAPLFVSEIFRTLQTLCATGITLVVVEQNARSVLRYCDYAFVLREGRLAFQGRAAAILADEETVKSYLGVGGKNVFARA